jgi:syntaxin 6
MEDPFFVVKDEVLKALLKTRDLYERWRLGDEGVEIRSSEEQEWAATELRNSLRSIEWDLEDLDDTVQIVEKNPAKFRIDVNDLTARKNFIKQTKDEVELMKQRSSVQNKISNRFNSETPIDITSLSSPTSASGQSSNNLVPNVMRNQNTKYSRLATTGSPSRDSTKTNSVSSTQELLQNQIRQQEHLVNHQDAQLSQMSQSVGTLRNMSSAIGSELDEQAVMLDEFGAEIEQAETKLDATMRKMAKVLNLANDRRQWMAIGVLSSAMVVLFIIIFAL